MNENEVIPQLRHRLCLHRGNAQVSREDIGKVKTPSRTPTWTPVSHLQLIQSIETAVKATGLILGQQTHSLNQDGSRYFGLMEVQGKQNASDYGWVLGVRNSHDKSIPAGIVAGAMVFVCDNLSFSGEVRLSRRHTRNILRDLPQIAGRAMGQLLEHWNHQDKRIEAYKGTAVSDSLAHDLLIRALDVRACTNRQIPSILEEWRKPRHEAFQKPSAWSLFNAFTEILKGNLPELPRRTEALHALFDTQVGLTARPELN